MLSTASRDRMFAGRFSWITTVHAASLSAVVPDLRTVCSHLASAGSLRSCSCSYALARRSRIDSAVARAAFTSSACFSSLTPSPFFFPFLPVGSLSSLISASCSCQGVPSSSLSITWFNPTREKLCPGGRATGAVVVFAGRGPTLSFQVRSFSPGTSGLNLFPFTWPFPLPVVCSLLFSLLLLESSASAVGFGCLGLGGVLKSRSSNPLPPDARPS
mmetsp:Transcript_39424/g.85779  ORF Transcript_39424/g.85779 Transcript_39424/m.85779 type:complete len:216 (+) Transcript_39424:597-1244(+)